MSQINPVVRCESVDERDALMVRYHDEEWGVPLHDDRALFELLTSLRYRLPRTAR